MDSAYTLVVPDIGLLTKLCGANDSNLRLIEQYLGIPVFSQGNELVIGGGDAEQGRKFRHIVERLMDEIIEGAEPDAVLLESIMNVSAAADGSAGEKAAFNEVCIPVPGGMRKVYPRTMNQAAFVRAMRRSDMVFCVGPAGTGKTFLAVAEALRLLLTRRVSSVVLTRPVVEAGESLGFLPGDLEQKITPYLRPLYDAMKTLLPCETIRRLTEEKALEIAPLAYMRGRTLAHSAVILDEAQNTTREQMKMFLTRMGEGSKIFVTGDITQPDLPARVPSGLAQALEILRSIPEVAVMEMANTDIVRHPLVKKIIQAYEYV